MYFSAKRVSRIHQRKNVFFSFSLALEPKDGLMAIGSGGNFALAAARALRDTKLSAEEIAKQSLEIAADLCIYTNNNIILEKI